MSKRLDILSLEEELTKFENDGFAEEQDNVKNNYDAINNKILSLKAEMPYPEIMEYETAWDLNEAIELQYKKRRNREYWDKIAILKKYYEDGSLYCGHFKCDEKDVYIMESKSLQSDFFEYKNGQEFHLINADDKKYINELNRWKYPTDYKDVLFSRNIELQNKEVISVDIKYDNTNSSYSDITDSFLRKALLRNKNNAKTESIIQTIQRKQDDIRLLDTDKSFILQGCAGSGKTMVLLHRLRYLIYNGDITSKDYALLIPGEGFKNFIEEISNKFNISKNSTYSYQEYYAKLVGKNITSASIANELVFDNLYLKDIYSEKFMRKCYSEFFDNIVDQGDKLVSLCENQLLELSETKLKQLEEKIANVEKQSIKKINTLIKELGLSDILYVDSSDDVFNIIEKIEQKCNIYRQKINNLVIPEFNVTVSKNDERILNNEFVIDLNKQIEKETIAFNNASRFTRRSHQRKLTQLQDRLEKLKVDLVESLKETDRNEKIKYFMKLNHQLNGVILSKLENASTKITDIAYDLENIKYECEEDIKYFDLNFDTEYNEQIELLNSFIEYSTAYADIRSICINGLFPCTNYISDIVNMGTKLRNVFSDFASEKTKEALKKLTLFSEKTIKQYQTYINILLFNICKKTINKKYKIKLCDLYKHYWYLNLQCRYLSDNIDQNQVRYLFLDEAQDLSVAELNLLRKLHSSFEDGEIINNPVINIFGDVHQTISKHGINNWKDLEFKPSIYTLDENFRNTNQIVEYCNSNLSMKMTKIGVDMDDVSVFNDISQAIKNSKTIQQEAIFIVKDEYAKQDLMLLLKQYPVCKDCLIYTVKDIKGLEFKEVFVFNRDMTDNEKYISYTRALIKLNIIQDLPKIAVYTNLIVDGNNEEENLDLDKVVDNTNTTNDQIIKDFQKDEDVVPTSLKSKATRIKVVGKYNGEYWFVPFGGKLKKYTDASVVNEFVSIMCKNKETYVLVSVDTVNKIIYINQNSFKNYKKEFTEIVELQIMN